MKLIKDFGVTAWIATLVIVCSFAVIFLGVAKGQIEWDILLPALTSFVGGATGAIVTLKGVKSGQNGGK